MEYSYVINLPEKAPIDDMEFMQLVRLLTKTGGFIKLNFQNYEQEGLQLEDGTYIYLGDCNCPHNKPYDARDGHGLTTIDVKDYEEGDTAYSVLWDMAVRLRKEQEKLIGTEPIKRV